MDLQKKLAILSDAAKYDVSCSSSGSTRKNTIDGLGNGSKSGICHSWSADGRCISLLKILFTNHCIYDCAYCVNRSSNDIPRAAFTPEEVADLTINFYKRNYIEGLFLSSAVVKSPDHTMELIIKTVKMLREQYKFNGYIHLKAIPGADLSLIAQAGRFADRISVNIELPSSESLKLLAPQKSKEGIVTPMNHIHSQIVQNKQEKGIYRYAPEFVPAGQTTQMIIGATAENDLKILRLSENLYKRYSLKRVYYSAYMPVSHHPSLPALNTPPLLREHRLYQADWLLRFYGFTANELLDEKQPDFDISLDPKANWAVRNYHLFPIEVNRADYNMLLRVPGIGVKSAIKIVSARRVQSLDYDSLKKLGVVLKRAKHFITCKGKYYGVTATDNELVRQAVISPKEVSQFHPKWEQISFFTMYPGLTLLEDKITSITGEF